MAVNEAAWSGAEMETVPVPLERLEGKYEILEKIKEGGMGAIYKVRHRLLDEVRVIKVIRPQLQSDETLEARFQREARSAIRLRHGNIAQLYDFTVDEEGNAFIVMEFIQGLTLDELLRRSGPPSVALALEVSRQTLDALAYLHRKSMVHRDISPDNLMLTREEDGAPLIKLIDLGLAKGLQDESGLTMQGTFLGKVRYASPEQFRSSEGVKPDQRSDIYSFGVVLYELLTGTLPIRGDSLSALIGGHLFDAPLPFAESDPEERVPAELRAAVLRALAKQPEERFQTAKSFAEALAKLQPYHPVTGAEVERLFREAELSRQRTPAPRGAGGAGRASGAASGVGIGTFDAAGLASLAAAGDDAAAGRKASRPAEPSKADLALAELEASVTGRKTRPPGAGAPRPLGSSSAVGETVPTPPAAERLAAVVALIEAQLGEGALDAASASAHRAEAELGASDELAAVRDRIAAARVEAGRRAAVAAALSNVEALLAEEDVTGARGALAEARAAGADDGEIERLVTEIDRLAAELAAAATAAEQRRREEAIAAAVRNVEALLAEGDATGARDVLAEARSAGADDAEIERLTAEIEAVAGAAEQRRREEALSAAKRRIESALEGGEADEAGRALAVAEKLFPGDEGLAVLRGRLDELEGRLRAARVAPLVEAATAATADGALERAVGLIQEALLIDPPNQELQDRLRNLRRRQALDAVRTSLDGGDAEAAESALRLAERLFGSAEELEGLRDRIAELKAASVSA